MPKTRKMLSDWDAPYIQSLVKQIETQSKTTLAQWAIDYAEHALLPLWSKHYPDDPRPWKALNSARDWLTGAIKLPQAKPLILNAMPPPAKQRETLLRKLPRGRSVSAPRRFILPDTVSDWRSMAHWRWRMTS